MSVCLFVAIYPRFHINLPVCHKNVENTPKCTRLYPCPTIPPAGPLAFGLAVLIMLLHLYDTAHFIQNFHDLSGKMNNMSLDHGRGAMLNRPPGPGGSYPPQVASKQFPQPTRFVPSTHTPTNPLQHLPPNEYEKWPYRKIIRYL